VCRLEENIPGGIFMSKQKELLELRKRNQQLEMENDILKQAALIFGRRDK